MNPRFSKAVVPWRLSGVAPVLCNGGSGALECLLARGCHACQADTAHLVIFTKVNGVKCIALECDGCGRSESTGLRKEYFGNWKLFPPYAGAAKRDEFYERKRKELEQRFAQEALDWQFRKTQLDAQRAAQYQDFLRSPQWYDMRSKVLERDNYTCQACGKRTNKFNLQVHHLTYWFGFDCPLFALVTVCRDCHGRLEARKNGSIDQWDPT